MARGPGCPIEGCIGYLDHVGRGGALACVACARRLAQNTALRRELERRGARVRGGVAASARIEEGSAPLVVPPEASVVPLEGQVVSDRRLLAAFEERFLPIMKAVALSGRGYNVVTAAVGRGDVLHADIGPVRFVSRADVLKIARKVRRRLAISRPGAQALVAVLPRSAETALTVAELAIALERSEATVYTWLERLGAAPELRRGPKVRNGKTRGRASWWWCEAGGGQDG